MYQVSYAHSARHFIAGQAVAKDTVKMTSNTVMTLFMYCPRWIIMHVISHIKSPTLFVERKLYKNSSLYKCR